MVLPAGPGDAKHAEELTPQVGHGIKVSGLD